MSSLHDSLLTSYHLFEVNYWPLPVILPYILLKLSRIAEVAEWQTRTTQNRVFARACGFDSHLRHNAHKTNYF